MRLIVPLLIAIAPVPALAQLSYSTSTDGLSYVLMTGRNTSTMISGSTDDWSRAQALRLGDAALLFVRQEGAAYVIRDPAYLRRAEAIMQPQQELGARQGKLGQQQGEIGRRQAALGAEQGKLGRLMADTPARKMADLGVQMAALGQKQAALGQEQAALGAQQAALGRQQANLAKLAQPKLRALVAEAIRHGVAQRVD